MKKLLFLLFMLILSISASSKNFKYHPKDTINPIKVKSKIDTFGIRLGYRLGSIKNKPKIKEVKTAAYTYNSVPEEDRINIADNLKGKNDSILTSRSSAAKNKKHFEDEIRQSNNL